MKTSKLVSLIKEMAREKLEEDNALIPNKRRKFAKRKLAEDGDAPPTKPNEIKFYPSKESIALNR